MSQDDKRTNYDPGLTAAGEEDYSLEEILTEFGSGLEQMLMRDTEPDSAAPEDAFIEDSVLEKDTPVPKAAASDLEPLPESTSPEAAPPEVVLPEVELPCPPRPVLLEEVVGSTVDAVLEETTEHVRKPRPGLFSRRTWEEPDSIQDDPEPIGPEPELRDAAEEARQRYLAGKSALLPALVVTLAALVPLLAEHCGLAIPLWTGDLRLQSLVLLGCLMVTALLCRQVSIRACAMLKKRRCGPEFLAVISALVSALDCAVCLLIAERNAVTPYGAVACLALVFAQWGIHCENRGMYDTFRTAAMDTAPPYLITDAEQGACKQRGAVPGFYSTAVRDNPTVLWQTAILPVVLVASMVFAGLASLERSVDFMLNWSAILTAGAAFSLPLCWALPFSHLARHLQKLGCAVAGWSGAEKISRRRRMVVTDTDLFPPGTIQFNGVKIYGEERKKVAAYSAAMAHRAGSGLERLFDGFCRSENAKPETVNDFSFYEEGGWSATIHGETVLMGTASFMRKMDVRLPDDTSLRTGVFLAIDRQLTAIFAVQYDPAENVDFALRIMQHSRITAILAVRDPNITPALLKRRFRGGVRISYPDLSSRVALSEEERDLPRALLFREGLLPYAETVVGSRRMCQAVRRTTAISLIGSILGTLLAFYMVFQGAYDLLTPLTLILFLLLWTVPVLLLVDWAGRY